MRQAIRAAAVTLVLMLALAACGTKDASTVVKDLNGALDNLESYQSSGRMELQTGEQSMQYSVEVWYQKPHYYRIALTNASKDVTQIVLRNDEGVFVLTPHLNKMFRFQSDWPDRSGQVYLFQSLVQSIVADENRQFTADKDAYVFDVAANYQNAAMLARQKIWLNKKSYAPERVEVMDSNAQVLVKLEFDKFDFGKKFDKDSFDMQRNMTSSRMQSLPTGAGVADDANKAGITDKNGATGEAAGAKEAIKPTAAELSQLRPTYMPAGVKEKDLSELKLGGGAALMVRYEGAYHYTVTIAPQPDERVVSQGLGSIFELGFTRGAIFGDELKTLIWSYGGTEYRITSEDLPKSELTKIAQSVLAAEAGK